jgi:diguanylate cyclase (GGDEF)-like protein
VPTSIHGNHKPRNILGQVLHRLEPDLGPLEAAYRRSSLRADAAQVSVLMYVFMASMVVYALVDYRLLGPSKTLLTLYILRGLALAVLGGSIPVLKRISSYVRMDRLALGYCLAFAGLTLYINTTRPASYFYNAPVDILILVAFYLAIPNRLTFRFLPALLLSAGDLVLFWFFRPAVSPIGIQSVSAALLAANAGCLLLSTQLYTYRRNQFKAQYDERLARLEVETAATIDPLTRVMNRLHFMEIAENEFQRFRRYRRPFCLLFIDLDHFKHINDTYGHLAGDATLQQFAALARSQVRQTDVVCRLGGDEFGILLPETETGYALEIANRLRSACAQMLVRIRGRTVQVTTSIGVTEVDESDNSLEETLNRSDQALYHVKQIGRNGVDLIKARESV